MKCSNSPLVNYMKISPNKTSPRNHAIDTITIHCMAGNLSVEKCGDLFYRPSRSASSNYGIGSDGRIAMYVEEKDRSWCTSNRANDMRAVTIEVANDGDASTGWHVSDLAMKSLIELACDICRRNGIAELRWQADKTLIGQTDKQNMTVHRWFAAKACPGDYLYHKHAYIAAEVNKRLGNPPVNPPNTPPVVSKPSDQYSLEQFISEVQAATGARIDGIAGPETLSKTVTVSRCKNNRHAVVKPLQRYLNASGYHCGTIDGIAGVKFDRAVKAYQKAKGCIVDGELTAGKNTWRSLLGLR